MFTAYLYVLIGLLSATISIVLAAISLRYLRHTRAVVFFSPMMFMVAVWQYATVFACLSKGDEMTMFWLTILLTALIFTVPLFLAFTLQYTGQEKWTSGWRLASLFIIPLVSAIMMCTNSLHHWMLREIHYVMDNGLLYSDRLQFGWYFWVHAAYCYILVLIAAVLIVQMAVRSQQFYRRQALILLIGIIPSTVSTFVDSFRLLPQLKHDISPVGFVLTGIVFFYAITRRQLLNVVPIARDMLIENMSDGMLVLNENGQIVDVNPAAEILLHVRSAEIIGKPVKKALAEWHTALENHSAGGPAQFEIPVKDDGEIRYCDVRISPILERRIRPIGYLVVLRDITQRKTMEERLRMSNETLTVQLSEINKLHVLLQEQVIRDPLTGLYNRRYLNETLKHEVDRAERKQSPLSVLMIDIDHFKNVNDVFGHTVGDNALIGLSDVLLNNVRSSDTIYRYGGEEFLIVLVDTPLDIAYEKAEMLRRNIEKAQITVECGKDALTVSIGVAAYPANGQDMWEVINAADVALYEAKAKGRNRVANANETLVR